MILHFEHMLRDTEPAAPLVGGNFHDGFRVASRNFVTGCLMNDVTGKARGGHAPNGIAPFRSPRMRHPRLNSASQMSEASWSHGLSVTFRVRQRPWPGNIINWAIRQWPDRECIVEKKNAPLIVRDD